MNPTEEDNFENPANIFNNTGENSHKSISNTKYIPT